MAPEAKQVAVELGGGKTTPLETIMRGLEGPEVSTMVEPRTDLEISPQQLAALL